jgi:MFS family permease
MEMLVACRTLQGVGGGGLLTLVEVILTDMVPIAERGAFIGIIALVWATGSVLGTLAFVLSNTRSDHWRPLCSRRTLEMVESIANVLIIGSST